MRIALVHPALGFGGAERLITDIGHVLRERGHEVTLFTAQIDRARAFDELQTDALPVRVRGSALPTSIAGRLRVPASIARTGYLSLCAALHGYDLLLMDLVAHALPLARALSRRARVFYYCHFPDALLAPPQRSWLYRLYRRPLDRLEEAAMNCARVVMVNSEFTAAALRETFPRVRVPVEIVSPGVDVATYSPGREPRNGGEILLLSIGRYEPSKGLTLAIEAFARLRTRLPAEVFARVRLVFAGGLNPDTPGSAQTYAALAARTRELALEAQVELRTSISDTEKLALLRRARVLVFTPRREHFGIAPLEAMACGTPVVAVNSGGPRETIEHGVTGFLCPPEPSAFAERLAALIQDEALALRMAHSATSHARANLSRTAFARRLSQVITQYAEA